MESAPPSKSNFNFIKVEGTDDSMLEYAKMSILLALDEYPDSENDWRKANNYVWHECSDMKRCQLVPDLIHKYFFDNNPMVFPSTPLIETPPHIHDCLAMNATCLNTESHP